MGRASMWGGRLVLASTLVTLLLFVGSGNAQSGFTADVVDLGRKGTPVEARIYFTAERMRIEPQNMTPRTAPPIIFIGYLKTGTWFAILPTQHVYAEVPPQQEWLNYTYFQSEDQDNGCKGWDKMSQRHSASCRKVGDENLNGRPAVKYEGRCSVKGPPCHIWIDPSLRFLVKWENGPKGSELRNIQVGAPVVSLFDIPKGFTKVKATSGTVAHK
jgi:hypothetical protein